MKKRIVGFMGVGATAFALATFLAITGHARGSIIDILGPAGDYAILGINGANPIHLSSGPLVVNGNVGAGDNSNFQFDGGGLLNGNVNYAATATVNDAGQHITGSQTEINFAPINAGVQNLENYANSLSATQSFSSINNAMTLQATTAVNVISVADGIHLSGGDLVLNGDSSQEFILKIGGSAGLQLSGNTNIILTGGLTAANVLWDVTASGNNAIQTSGKSDTAGIFLAPNGGIQINGGVHNSEFISSTELTFQSNPTVNQPLSPVPEANAMLPLLLVLGAVIGGRYGRRVFAGVVRIA